MSPLEPLLILALAINFFALGVSRIHAVIGAVAVQGMTLGILSLFFHDQVDLRSLLLAAGIVALKGFFIPGTLFHAMREVNIQRAVQPLVSPIASLFLGAAGTGLALAIATTLPLTSDHAGGLLVPASFATVFTGFLMLTTRRRAIMQVLGYLILENGIFLFGLLLLEAMPFLVETGVLLDLFTGVFVMGIIIHHINREFDSVSTEHLAELRE